MAAQLKPAFVAGKAQFISAFDAGTAPPVTLPKIYGLTAYSKIFGIEPSKILGVE
jgi:hypothetical protein